MDFNIASNKFYLRPIFKYLLVLLVATGVAYLVYQNSFKGFILPAVLPFVGLFFVAFYKNPKIGLFVVTGISFSLSFFGRYYPVNFPIGLAIDLLMVLNYIILVLRHWKHLNFKLAGNLYTFLMCLWMFYIILQLGNPEAVSKQAWFYAMRSMGLYQFLSVPLALVLLNTKKDFKNYFILWIVFSLLGAFWGIKQLFYGVSETEQLWLNMGAYRTHLIYGKLRVFSYYSDAGTFGAAMGQIAVMMFILCLGPFSNKKRVVFGIVGLITFYALMISGTRGALAVPAVGGMLYIVMIRNTKIFSTTLIVLALGFSFLRFTTILNTNYEVYRLRTSVRPSEDASFALRVMNRKLLSEYLKGKPFGGGVGACGFWGARFSPNTWLGQFPPDGLYTKLRAETGIVGRNLYVGIWLLILAYGVRITWRLKNQEYKTYCMAILAGFAGIMLANYGNEVLNSHPISMTSYIALTFVFSIRYWDEKGNVKLPKGEVPIAGRLEPKTTWGDEAS